MPNRRSRTTKRRNTRKKPNYQASDAPLILQPTNPVIRRNLQSYSVQSSSAGGTVDTAIDITSALVASADWTNMSGSYLAVKVHRVAIEIVPFIKMYTIGSNYYHPNVCVGYNPSSYANPGSNYIVLNNACSQWLILNSKHQMSFTPQVKSGAKGPIDITVWNAGNVLGSLQLYGSASFPASVTAFAVRFVFTCDFTNPG
jgi:hypothetical protein